MLFGNRKVDEQYSNKLDKMSSFTAIGSDMMKKNGVNNGNNENNNKNQNENINNSENQTISTNESISR